MCVVGSCPSFLTTRTVQRKASFCPHAPKLRNSHTFSLFPLTHHHSLPYPQPRPSALSCCHRPSYAPYTSRFIHDGRFVFLRGLLVHTEAGVRRSACVDGGTGAVGRHRPIIRRNKYTILDVTRRHQSLASPHRHPGCAKRAFPIHRACSFDTFLHVALPTIMHNNNAYPARVMHNNNKYPPV